MKLNTQLTYRETSSIFSGSVVAGKDQKTNIYYFNRLARKLPVETGEQDYRTTPSSVFKQNNHQNQSLHESM
jgi:hypothetical protein